MWNKWILIGWFILTALVVGYELWTNATGRPTLTDVTVQYMPWWATLIFIGWLLLHFATSYANHQGWTSKGFHFFAQW